jgi:hypothetical protein
MTEIKERNLDRVKAIATAASACLRRIKQRQRDRWPRKNRRSGSQAREKYSRRDFETRSYGAP